MLFFLLFELSVLFGFLLDLLFADPQGLPHPVVIIGKGISFLEKHLRRAFPDTPAGRRAAGRVMAALIPLTTFVVTAGLCLLAWMIHPVVFFLLHTLWCWQAVAIRGLAKEAENVYRCLKRGDASLCTAEAGHAGSDPEIDEVTKVDPEQHVGASEHDPEHAGATGDSHNAPRDPEHAGATGDSHNAPRHPEHADPDWLIAARKAVSRIVGRDTQALDAAGVTRAAVETVAENYSDGVIAPYLYMMIGGAPLALTYKSVNTMDSMVGYKNERYIDFGRGPAHLDDVAGYVPARIGALLWILAAGMTKGNMKNAWRIWRRDNRNHASPNSAQTESACAGALGIQLAGPAYYFGELYEKPTIGDPLRPIEAEDIRRANRMLYAASVLALLLCMVVSCVLLGVVML